MRGFPLSGQSAIGNRKSQMVSHSSDASAARRAAKQVAQAIGFGDRESDEIALVVSELASNLVKHAGGGMLTLTPITDALRVGLQIESVDSGPGIPDVEQAITDGFSTADSLGYGLGTVNRLMDEFDISSEGGPEHSTRIVCTRWLCLKARSIESCPLDLGAATRGHPGMTLNGDAFVTKKRGESALVAVIDGLGHGQYAHRAAQKAREYVERHFDQPLISIFRGTGRACLATRGVVMALARFAIGDQNAEFGTHATDRKTQANPAVRNQQAALHVTFATIGNIEARVFGGPEPVGFRICRGIIGANAPNPAITEHRWDPSNVMVLHTDGLTTRWRWEDFAHLASQSATEMAQGLLCALAKDNDDATVVVVKEAV